MTPAAINASIEHLPDVSSFTSGSRELVIAEFDHIARLIEPTIRALGFDLVLVRLHGGSRPRLQVMAESQDVTRQLTVDDCADISHAVSAVLDVADPIKGAYTLEVSSPGLDRPLVRPDHFVRFRGERAKLETELPLEGRKRFVGRLEGLEGGDVLIALDDGEGDGFVRLPLAGLRKAKLQPDEVVPKVGKPSARDKKRKG